jgi:hypothetical protein
MHRFLQPSAIAMAALLWLWAGVAQAQTTYSYSGQPFVAAEPPYTTADRVVGSFETAEPLDPWLIDSDISDRVTGFSYSDGQQTRTSTDSVVCAFRVTTDATGAIVDWWIDLRQAGLPPPPLPLPFIQSSRVRDESGIGFTGDAPCGDLIPSETGRLEFDPGTWSGGASFPAVRSEYRYRGEPFDQRIDLSEGPNDVIVTFAGPLPPFLEDAELSLFVSSALLSTSNSAWRAVRPCSFRVSTNASGLPVEWEAVFSPVFDGPGPIIRPGVFKVWGISDEGDWEQSVPWCASELANASVRNSVPGTWSRGAIRSIPALQSVGLLLLILAVLAVGFIKVNRP